MFNKKLIVFIFTVFLSFPSFATLVGTVDVQKILVTVKEGQKVRDKLKGEFEKKQKELKSEEDKIRKLQEDFKKQSLVMNEDAKLKKQQKIQESILALQQKTMGYQNEIQGMENELKKPILEKVKAIIEDISKSEGVDMTFEVSSAPIIYAKNQVDLTEKVITEYNKKHK